MMTAATTRTTRWTDAAPSAPPSSPHQTCKVRLLPMGFHAAAAWPVGSLPVFRPNELYQRFRLKPSGRSNEAQQSSDRDDKICEFALHLKRRGRAARV
jgi:hypothetical protein